MKEQLSRLVSGETLSRDESRKVMDTIMLGEATDSQIASLLSILRFRHETVDELTGFVESLREHAETLTHPFDVIDTCGTGGDGLNTFNISTATAILLSSMNVKVAKHGNRAVSSKSGSADVLDHLSIPVQTTMDEAYEQLDQHNMCFLYAPLYHRSMKYAAHPRKELGFRTFFNILGPLINPANSQKQIIGVFDFELAKKMAYTLQNLGVKRAVLVSGDQGLDECSITGQTRGLLVTQNEIEAFTITPEDVGLTTGRLEDIQVQSAQDSAALIESILKGDGPETATDIVLLNTGTALYAAGKTTTISEGVHQARTYMMNGTAYEQLKLLKMDGRRAEQHA